MKMTAQKIVSSIKYRVLSILGFPLSLVFNLQSSLINRLIVRLPLKYRIKVYNLGRTLTRFPLFKSPLRRRLSGALMIAIIVIPIILQVLVQVSPPQKPFAQNPPYNEKIAEGVWALKNRDPIRQVLAEGPKAEDLKVKENHNGSYKWIVTNGVGTRFMFGKQDKKGILPYVRIVNKEGFFVEYSPKTQKNAELKTQNNTESEVSVVPRDVQSSLALNYVTPKVEKNVISWEISKGVVARYTMEWDRVKADYIVDNPKVLCGLASSNESKNQRQLSEALISTDNKQISADRDLAGFFPSGLAISSKSNIEQEKSDQKQGGGDLGSISQIDKVFGIHKSLSVLPGLFIGGSKKQADSNDSQNINNGSNPYSLQDIISHNFSASFSNRMAKIKESIPAGKFIVNKSIKSSAEREGINVDTTTIVANQAAERLVNNPDNTFSVGSFKDILIGKAYASESDSVKADDPLPCGSPRLEFDVTSGNENNSQRSEVTRLPSPDGEANGGQGGQKLLKAELLSTGDIDWFSEPVEESGVVQNQFTFPAPVVYDAKHGTKQNQTQNNTESGGSVVQRNVQSSSAPNGEYSLKKLEQGSYGLSILLPKDKLEKATWPLIIDPVAVDATATAIGTAYGNGRKILRDGWGNLIAVFDGGTGDDNVYYKSYSSKSWTDAAIDLDGGAGSSNEIAADLDSSNNVQVAYRDTTLADIVYVKLTVVRDGGNRITSISKGSLFSLDTTGTQVTRPSLIVANKGGGAGVEKVAVAYAMNGSNRGEIRFMQCDVSDDCTSAGNWKNASEEINGSGTCSDSATSGNAGLPDAVTCKGTADKLIATTDATNTHHGVITQMPGKPKRNAGSVKKDLNGTFSDLNNLEDGSSGTTDNINSLTTTDYLYVGDLVTFSKISIDIDTTNSNAQTFSTTQYCSANSDVNTTCDTWSSVSNFIDNTATGTTTLLDSGDAGLKGSFLFDEPSNWVQSTENGTKEYWTRFRPSGALDSTVSLADIYLNDRNSKALMVVGGVDSTNDLGASYVVWDDIGNVGWENNPASAGAPWRNGGTALSTTGFESTFSNYVLSAATDYVNNPTYVGYMEGTAVGSSNITVKSIANNKDPTVAANWTDTALPAMTEAADSVISLTTDGQDLYMFYVLDPGTNSMVFRRCSVSGGGLGTVCDNASDWGSEKTLDNGTDNTHPQAVVTKVTGDTIAIDVIYTTTTGPAVEYERHFVDLTDKTIVVAASGDDAEQIECADPAENDQFIAGNNNLLGWDNAAFCSAGAGDYNLGFNFPSVTVAQGAVISSAYIDLRQSQRSGTDPVNFTIYGEDRDNSSDFVAYTNNCPAADLSTSCIYNRTRTTSSYSNSIDFPGTTSTGITYRFDVTDIVQEIVCRGAANSQPCVGNFNGSGSWASGNNLALLFISSRDAAPVNYIQIIPFDNTGTTMLDPTLQINVASSGTTGKNFSMGSATQLATGSASFTDFDHPLSSLEFASVATDDTNFASISAVTNYASSSAVPAFMFKQYNSYNQNTYAITAQAIVKSTLPTSSNPVYLQVYRGGSTNDWVTMASNNNTAADTDITLTPPVVSASPTEYYFNETPGIGTRYAACTNATANCWTYWRLYQEKPNSNLNEVLSLDYVSITFTGPDKVTFTNSARELSIALCNGAGEGFTMELQQGSTASNPTQSTVVRVTSDSGSYTIYSDSSCTTSVTNGDFTYSTSENSKSVYIIDNGSEGTYTLSGTRQSGDTLTTGTQNYTLLERTTRVRGGVRIRGGTKFQ